MHRFSKRYRRGLAAICRQKLEMDPFSGTLFLFRNRARNALKILVYDGQGFWLCTKRLSRGKFHWWPKHAQTTVSLHVRDVQTLLGKVQILKTKALQTKTKTLRRGNTGINQPLHLQKPKQ